MPPGWLGLAGLLQTNASSSASRTLLGTVCFESGCVLESLASCYVPMAACLPGRACPFPGPGGTLGRTQLLFSGRLYLSPNVGKCENRSKSSSPGSCSTAPSSRISARRLMRDTLLSLPVFPSPRVLQLCRSFSFPGGVLGITDTVVLI